MKKKSLNFKLTVVVVAVIAVFILGHLSPTLAIRTHLIFSGHPVSGATSQLTLIKKTGSNKSLYEVSDPPVEKATGAWLCRFEVQRYMGILYFAEYPGVV